MISLADFQKLEIKIGTVLLAEPVPKSEKLLRLVVDIGSEERQIVSGIAQSFPDPAVLVGKQLPILLNLEPRTFLGYESQGMILVIETNDSLALLLPEHTVAAGSVVR